MKTSELDGMHYDTVKSPWGQRVERGDFDEDAPHTHRFRKCCLFVDHLKGANGGELH